MTDILIASLQFYCKDKTQKQAAAELGISAQYLSDVLNGHRPMSEKLASKLGWEKIVTWVPK